MKHTSTTTDRLKAVLETITGSAPENIDPQGDIKSQLALDSMQFVQLFSALEAEFSIELPLSIMNVSKVHEFISILEERLSSLQDA